MSRKALLVTDMLNDFIDPQGALYVGEAGRQIIPFIAGKIAETRAQGGLVFYLCDAHAPDDPEFQRFPAHAVKGTWGAAIIPELTPAPGDIIVEKTRYSPFSGTDLEAILRREGITEAGVVGVCTSICVLETVRGLFEMGILAIVYRDGVADFDPEAHAFALKYMPRIFGATVT